MIHIRKEDSEEVRLLLERAIKAQLQLWDSLREIELLIGKDFSNAEEVVFHHASDANGTFTLSKQEFANMLQLLEVYQFAVKTKRHQAQEER